MLNDGGKGLCIPDMSNPPPSQTCSVIIPLKNSKNYQKRKRNTFQQVRQGTSTFHSRILIITKPRWVGTVL